MTKMGIDATRKANYPDEIRVPGNPRAQIVAPAGYKIAHTALPKLAFGPKGEPWVFHRVLRRALNTPGTGF